MKSKHLLLTLLMALVVPWVAQAQDLADYTFSTGTDDTQWITLSDGLSSIVSAADDSYSALTDIGFSFPFGDGTYTKFWANANGIFSFSSSPNGNYSTQFNSSNLSANQPKICGITRDMGVSSNGGYVKYELTGTAPNRVLVCEFNLQSTSGSSGTPTVNFQVQLHENDSKVVLVYGAAASPSSFQIGLSQSTSDVWTINPSTHEATHSTGAVSTTYNAWPGANRYYQFERPVWTCFKPINLGVSALSTTSATLTWEESGDATNWVLQYGTDSEFNTCTEVNVSNTPSFDATVTAGDTYYFRVKPDCDTDGSKWSNPFEFTVPCEAIAALSFDKGNLDSYTGTSSTPSANNLPDCWSYINNCTYSSYKYYPVIYSSSTYAHSGSNSLRFYSYGYSSYDPQPQYAILPPMEDLAGKQVTLQARGYNASSTFKIGTMSNPMNVNTFHLITEQTGLTTSYQEFEYLIPSTCTDNYLVIMIEAATGYNYNGAYIDDIVIATPPTCIKPSSLDVTADGLDATFTWESTESQWQVAHAMSATANPDDNIVDLVSTKSFTMNDLPLGDHYFWVRSYCSSDDQSIWVGPASVHIGYCLPAPSSTDGNGISNITFGIEPNVVNNDTPKAGYADYTTQIGAVQAGVEADVAITYGHTYTYGTFIWVDLNKDLDFEDEGELLFFEVSAGSSTAPHTLTAHITIPATQAVGDYVMRIGGGDNLESITDAAPCYTGTWAAFQDYTLRVLEAPSCLTPSGFDVTDYEATWNVGDGTKWNLQYKKTSETDWTAVTGLTAATYSFNLTELDYGTVYEVQVQTDCGTNGTSDWTNSKTFTTPLCDQADMCQIHLALTDSYGDGWNGNTLQVVDVSTNLVLGTFAGIDHNLSSTSCTDDFYLSVCDGRQIQFVYVLGSGTTYPSENSFVIYDVNGEVICEHGSNPTDFEFTYTANCTIITCRRPSDLTCTAKTGHTATFDWTDGEEGQTAWQISYSTDADFNPDKGTIADITHTDNTISGLAANTQYYAYIRANCGTSQEPDYSNWSVDKAAFKTNIGNPAPTAFHTTDIQQYQAGFDWTNGGGDYEESWMIYLWNESIDINNIADNDLDPSGFRSAGSHPTAIINLTPGTTYYAWVRSNCGSDGMSAWTALEGNSFMTVPTCPAPENLIVVDDSETTDGATITWEGTNDSFVVELGTVDLTSPIVTTLINEGFEDGSLPDGWTTTTTGYNNWTVASSVCAGVSPYGESSYAAGTPQGTSSRSEEMYIITPAINLSEAASASLHFYYYQKAWGSDIDPFGVYYRIGTTDTWHELFYSTTSTSSWTEKTITLINLADDYQIGFYRKDNFAYGNAIDDVTVTMTSYAVTWAVDGTAPNVENTGTYTFHGLSDLTPYKARVQGLCGDNDQSPYSNAVSFTTLEACPAPKDFVLGEVTDESAAFSWDGGIATEWNVWVKKSTETEYPTDYYTVTTPSKTVEGLEANTYYDVKIIPTCDETKALEVENAFHTECSVIPVDVDNMYLEGFEGDVDCWAVGEPETTSGNSRNWTATNDYYHKGSWSYTNGGYYGPVYLYTPTFNITGDVAQLSFWSYEAYTSYYTGGNNANANGLEYVKVSTDGGTEWTTLWCPTIDEISESWHQVNIDLSAYTNQDIQLCFLYEGNNAHQWYIDDVRVAIVQTFEKEIIGYGDSENGGYYLIASPLADDVNPTTINGMVVTDSENDYDLYSFDQTQSLEWRNYKNNAFSLVNGQGYLYANKNDVTLTFTGVAYSGDGVFDLIYSTAGDEEWRGWNLVGNPFPYAVTVVDRDFYAMNDGHDVIAYAGTGNVDICEGIFVQAQTYDEQVTFTKAQTAVVDEGKENLVLSMNLFQQGNRLDVAHVRFNEGRGLEKFQLNPNHTKVYIPQNGKDYAVVCTGQVGELPVCFKTENNGSYTLSFTSENVSFSYLHLIDNMTGIETNLLETPSYSFDARTTDYASRFRLVFATGSSAESDSFGFVNGMGNLCIFGIEGEATLQVIDVTGRVLSSNQFSGSYEQKLNVAPGVYMLRLINGNDVKVQKIVME